MTGTDRMTLAEGYRMLTPPQVARRLAVKPGKVLGWIKSGELKAINVAQRPSGRPRWRIDPADLAAFEARRSAGPTPKPVRRRRRNPQVIEFF